MSATKVDTFGAKVEEHRERLGMLQKELAERSGLSKSHLNRIEKGTRKRPHVKKVLRMIEELRLTRGEAKELCELADLSPLVLENINFEEEWRGFTVVKVEDDEPEEEEDQARGVSIPNMPHPALDIQNVVLGPTGKEIERLLGLARLSEEEEKWVSVEVIEFTKRQLALIEKLRQREDV